MNKVPRKILVISPCYPYPPDDGHKVRIWNLLRYLGPEWEFDFLALDDLNLIEENHELRTRRLGPYCKELILVDQKSLQPIRLTNWMDRIKNIYYPFEFSLGIPFYSETLASIIKSRIESGKYDLVFYNGFYISLHGRPWESQVPYVVDIIDSFSLLMKTLLKTEKRPQHKLKGVLNYIWARRYEAVHFSKAKNVIMIAPVDKAYVERSCPQSKIWVVPNGVDVDFFRPNGTVKPKPNSLLFTGVMSYRPNEESIVYFIKNVLPLIRKEIPDTSLTIAGKEPSQELQSYVKKIDGIKVTGYVEDIRPFFNQSMVYVAPMISGSGIKNKILEAWAMGNPVVATTMASQGLNAINGDNILLADSPESFANKIVEVFKSTELQSKLRVNSRRTAKAIYSWTTQSRKLQEVFENVLKKKQT